MAKVYTFNKALHHFLIFLIKIVFRFRFPLKLTNPEILKEMKPPYILLPNHTMMWDVILNGLVIPHPIHYMSSDAHFRNKKIAFFLKLFGTFPKAKAKNDLSPIKHMMSLKEQKKVVCIYPEGQMTWDGQSLPPFYSTAKLLKLLKIPVYMPITNGAYAVRPRWSAGRRKGPMEMTIKTLEADGRAFKQQSADEIFKKMRSILTVNEYDQMNNRAWDYESKARAEYLENFLFICPECSSLAKLRSEGNRFACTACGSERELDSRYSFHLKSASASTADVATPGAWNEWQKKKLAEMLEAYDDSGSSEPFMIDENMVFKTGYRQDPPKLWTKNGEMALYRDHILLNDRDGEDRKIPFAEMTGAHVLTRQRLEFYHQKTLYIFGFPNLRCSGYKWLCAFKTLGVPSSYVWASDEIQDN